MVVFSSLQLCRRDVTSWGAASTHWGLRGAKAIISFLQYLWQEMWKFLQKNPDRGGAQEDFLVCT